jgi:hypothetical protein
MHRSLAYCVVGLLVAAAVAAPAVAAPAAGAGTPDGAFVVAQEEFDSDQVSLTADLEADGDAAWTFTYRMRLATDNETEAFESLQADIEANESEYTDRFRSRIEATVRSAENATGREMSVADVSVSTRINSLNEESLGVVEYSFAWSGFAATDGERVVAGDALEGFYLNNETSLQFAWPGGYEAVEVDPPADESGETSVRWNGPVEFGSGEPRLVVAPGEPGGTTSGAPGTTVGTPPETTTDAGSGGSVLFPVLVGALAAAVVLGGAGWLYWRREAGDDGGEPGPPDGDTDAGGTGGAESAAGAAGGEGDGEPPEELLSNEERVEKFLREQGGRAKQQDVVDAMGWTEAKTSQVVKEMRENDDLEAFRIGRENVLKLPDADVSEE